MPNSYTAPLYEGKDQSLQQFAARCARAMGVFYHQRDESLDSPLRYQSASQHKLNAFKDALRKEWQFRRSSEESKYAQWSAYVELKQNDFLESQKKALDLAVRYNDMIAQVERKEVPPALDSFKKIMLDFLKDSKASDCGSFRFRPSLPMGFVEYVEYTQDRNLRDVEYYRRHLREQRQRDATDAAYIKLIADTFDLEVLPA